ncbi:MAG: hypothetical protein Q8S20_08465, partial [Sulfuritalea sp.]|nr:hypothetical protein [Sulfuritalea sp.]
FYMLVRDSSPPMATSIFLSKKHTLWVFLYSLLFLGTAIPYISLLCILAVVPFTGGAWIAGMAAVSLFKTNVMYLPAAWLAVFLQAYIVAAIAKAFRKPQEDPKTSGATPP